MAGRSPDGLNDRLAVAEEALRRTSVGLTTSLNAIFYSRHGRSFVESLVTDPLNTYMEALTAASNGLVESAIKVALRAMGLDQSTIERFIEALRGGDGAAAASLLRSLLHM